jgi:hypothetical protein
MQYKCTLTGREGWEVLTTPRSPTVVWHTILLSYFANFDAHILNYSALGGATKQLPLNTIL